MPQQVAPPASQLAVGMIVETRDASNEYWIPGYVTSVEPLRVTVTLGSPDAVGLSCAEVRLVPAARLAQLRAALAELPPPPPASELAVGMIVEWRNPGETSWSPGYVTSVEPLKVTVNLVGGPAAPGLSRAEVRLLPAARVARLRAEVAAALPPPPASALSVGMVVERRDPGKPWAKGYVTSVEPLKVTVRLEKGPAALGCSWAEVRLVPGPAIPEGQPPAPQQPPQPPEPQPSQPGDPFAAEVVSLKISVLKKRARILGATAAQMDEVDDADDPRAALVALMLSLRSSLQGEKVSALKKRLRTVGATEEQMDELDDAVDTKSAAVDLLFQLAAASLSAGPAAGAISPVPAAAEPEPEVEPLAAMLDKYRLHKQKRLIFVQGQLDRIAVNHSQLIPTQSTYLPN
eukprot:COSAG03_NODE_1939_length_3323_cov_386.678350_2_plen_404_part_00